MRKGISLLIALTMLLSLALTACSGGNESVQTPSGTDPQDGKLTLNMVKRGFTDVHPPAEELWMWKKYEEMSGIRVNFEEIPAASMTERKNVIMGSNDLPDAFYRMSFNADEMIKYGEQGLFVPLEDLIDQHAPNVKKLFSAHPDIKKALTMPDGHIYSLPYVDFSKAFASLRLYINKEWLDASGLAVPKTTEELRNALKAFRQQNGQMGWVMPSGTFTMLEQQLLGSFGMGNGGLKAAGQQIYKDKDGELKTIFNDPKYKEVWMYLHELWKDGSLPQQNFSGYEYSAWVADASKNAVGAFSWADSNYIGEDNKPRFVGINFLEGPNGDKVVNWMDPPTRGTSAFIITKNNQHPAETIKWVDYFYGEEGSLFGTFGIEGETYKMIDGKPDYIDDIKHYKGGIQLGAFQYVDNVYGAYYPYVEPKDEWRTAAKGKTVSEDIQADAAELETYAPEELWPDFVPTPEESKEISAIMTDIQKYIDEMRVKFITGKASFDADWDTYLKTLDKMGAQKYLDMKRQQYERYKAIK